MIEAGILVSELWVDVSEGGQEEYLKSGIVTEKAPSHEL